MQIVILNDSCFEQRHFERLGGLGRLTVFPDTSTEEEATARLANAEIAIMDGFKFPLTRSIITHAASLQFVVLNSTAFHMIDLNAANERGVRIANTPGYATEAVAEHAIALMFAVARRIPWGDAAMREYPFQIDGGDPGHRQFRGVELRAKTLGIVGLGAIGRRIAELGMGLGMRTIAYNRSHRMMNRVEMVEFDQLLRESDFISINLALDHQTENIISERELSLMKASAVLINTADGKHVDTQALYKAIRDRRILGAGLDVLAEWDSTNPLLELDNVVLSPQIASWTNEACVMLADQITDTVEAFVRGDPINLID